MYLNIVSALRLPNEAISGTPQIAGPNTLGREKRSIQATAQSALPRPLLFDSAAWLDKASCDFGRQTDMLLCRSLSASQAEERHGSRPRLRTGAE